MIRHHIPAECADEVREALAGTKLWLGVKYIDVTYKYDDDGSMETFNGAQMPQDVRAMLAPCDTCDGDIEQAMRFRDWGSVEMIQSCPDCRDGRPLVELVTDCYCLPIRDAGRSAWPYGDCLIPQPCDEGTVTLGTVVAHEVLPIVDPLTLAKNAYPPIIILRDGGRTWVREETPEGVATTVVTLIGPPDATRAIRLEVVR
jgi:hypothetical protein